MNRVPPVIGAQFRRFRLIGLWAGILIGDLAAAGLFFTVQRWVAYMNVPMGALLAVPNILLVPAFGGLVTSWIWRKLNLTILGNLIHSVSMTAVGILVPSPATAPSIACHRVVRPPSRSAIAP